MSTCKGFLNCAVNFDKQDKISDLILEMDRINDEHFMFNLGILQTFMLLRRPLELVVIKSHWETISMHLQDAIFRRVHLLDPKKAFAKKNLKFRLFQIFWLVRPLLKPRRYHSIWILSIPLLPLAILYVLQWFRSEKIFIAVQGEIEKLKKNSLKAYFYRLMLRCPWKQTVTFFVMSAHVEQEVRRCGFKTLKLISVDINIPGHSRAPPHPGLTKSFALIGRHQRTANIRLLEDVFCKSSDLQLNVLGFVSGQSCLCPNQSQPVWLARPILEEKLRDCHGVLLPYEAKDYSLTVSGVVFEALWLGIPILSFPNAFANYLHKLDFPIEILPQTTDGIRATLELVLEESYKKNYQRKRAQFLPRYQPGAFAPILDGLLR
jgi:hypothetical protein